LAELRLMPLPKPAGRPKESKVVIKCRWSTLCWRSRVSAFWHA